MSGVFFLFPQQVVNNTGQQFVLNNAAVTADGYQVISGFGSNEIVLLINIKNPPSGINPTITFTMQEVDPIDQTTSAGATVSSAALNAAGVTQLTMANSTIGTVKVSWHITGTNTPTFTGVNVTVLQKVAGSTVTSNIGTTGGLALDATLTGGTAKTQMYDGTNTIGTALHPVKIDPTGTTTQPVSGSVTANIGTTNGLALDATLTGGAAKVRITDGYNIATVKPASTAPLATDPALVVAMSPNSTVTTTISDVTSSISLAALNSTNVVSTVGSSHIGVNISGTWSGVISFEASIDGTNYIPISGTAITTTDGTRTSNVSSFGANTTSANGQFRFSVHGYGAFRLRMSTYNSGSATTFLRSTLADGPDNVQLIMPSDSSSIDAFSRLRVSTSQNLFSSKFTFDTQPLFWDDQQISGSGTSSSFLTNRAAVQMNVNQNTAGVRVRQTFRRFNYQPGKGQLSVFSGVLVGEGGTGVAQVNRRIGLFDGYNGVFFVMTGTTLGVAVRTNTSGTPTTTVINQSNWNLDTFDGTGGINNGTGLAIDVSKSQKFVIDFQWGGSSRVRFGFFVGGRVLYCHQFTNINTTTASFIGMPNLPIRYELESVGGGAAATSSMLQLSSSVSSECGFEDIGYLLTADRGTTVLTSTSDTNIYSLLALQLQPGRMYTTIIPQAINISSSSGATGSLRYMLLLNPTIAGSLSWTPVANSSIQYAVPGVSNTITAGTGTLILSGYDFFSKAVSTPTNTLQLSTDLLLGSSIAGVSDTLVLAVQATTANIVSYYGSITWEELV